MTDISATTSSTTTSTTPTATSGSGLNQPTITFTGISSGIDTSSIVTELMQIESQPKVLLQQKQLVVNARTAAYQDIQTKLYTLKTAADDLRSLTLFNGTPYTSSSDTTRLTAAATSNASPGTYDVNVTRMAAANVKQQQATSFTSSFGYAYAGNGAYAAAGTKITDLTDASGSSLGLAKGQTITLQSTKNGTAQTPATFTVTDTTTLEDLRSFVQTNLAGSTVTLGQGGKMQITSPPGDEQAFTGVSLLGPGGTALGGAGGVGTTDPPAPTGSLGSVLVHGSGNVHITSSGIPIDIAVTDGMSMTDVAKAINNKNGSLGASVVNGTLRLAARQQGASSAIQMTMDSGVSLGTFTDAIAAQDAAGTVNGVAFSSATNTVTSAISGVTLSLQGTTPSAPITLTVDPARVDPDAIVTKVKTFVTAYNDVIQTLTDKTTEKSVQNPTTDDDRIKGALFGDSTLTGLLNQLRQGMQNPISGLSTGKNIMNYAGLSTGAVGQAYTADSASGKLVLDETKLRSSIAAGTADIKSLFASNGAHRRHQGPDAADLGRRLQRDPHQRHAGGRDHRHLVRVPGHHELDQRDAAAAGSARDRPEDPVHRDGDGALEPEGHAEQPRLVLDLVGLGLSRRTPRRRGCARRPERHRHRASPRRSCR